MEAVLFDVGGTLWPDRPSVSKRARVAMSARRLARRLSLAPTDAALLVDRLAEDAAALSDKQETDAHVVSVVDGLGWSDRGIDLLAVREAMCIPGPDLFDLFPGVPDLLRSVRNSGVKCALVSNTQWRSGESYKNDFEHWGLAECIDAYITSLDVGYRKPNSRMFHAALEAVEVEADAAVMVGDSMPNDVAPAQALGMRTVLMAVESAPPEPCPADFVARSMRDVERWLLAWR